jgi:hypothetical protein
MRERLGRTVPWCFNEHAISQAWQPVHRSGWIASSFAMPISSEQR